MPITSSAKKAHRQSLNKKEYNRRRKDKVSEIIKSLKKLVIAGDKKEAQALLSTAQKAIDKAVKGNTIKQNTASRKKSALAKLVKSIA